MQKKIKSPASINPATGFGDRFALLISDILGSAWFLLGCLTMMAFYILWNCGAVPGLKPFDHLPFNILDTILSAFAIVLSMTVLISQKRQRKLEKIREEVEFEVNVRAEKEITKILEMLHEIQLKVGIRKEDKELEEMKKQTDITELHHNIKRKD